MSDSDAGFFVVASSGRRTGKRDDDSAALFECTFDESIGPLSGFNIELVSSVVRRQNSVVLTDLNNKILFRMGSAGTYSDPQPVDEGGVGEMYIAQIRTGAYSSMSELALEISKAMNAATPCNAWRHWSCSFDPTTSVSAFQLSFAPPASPGAADASIALIQSPDILNYSYPTTYTESSTKSTLTFDRETTMSGQTLFNCSPRCSIDSGQPAITGSSWCGSDVGSSPPVRDLGGNKNSFSVINQSCSSIDIGVVENGGRLIADYSPSKVVTSSNYITDQTYYVLVDKRVAGSAYANNPQFYWADAEPLTQTLSVVHPYLSGILLTSSPAADPKGRGPPYTRSSSKLHLPAKETSTPAQPVHPATRSFTYTYEGNLVFQTAGAARYSFHQNMENAEGRDADHASSNLYLGTEDSTEPMELRRANACLITGLQQKSTPNNAVQTYIDTASGILQQPSVTEVGGTRLEYILGSIGRFNVQNGLLSTNRQGELNGKYYTPRYMIMAVSGDKKQVTSAILLDGGEYILPAPGTGPTTDSSLFFNDPATYQTFPPIGSTAVTVSDVTEHLCTRCNPTAADIQTNAPVDPGLVFRYLGCETSLANDRIFTNTSLRHDPTYRMNLSRRCDFAKDLSVELSPKEDSFYVRITQFQPTDALFTNESYDDSTFLINPASDQFKTLLLGGQMSPATWNSIQYASGAPSPSAWTVGTAAGNFNVQKADPTSGEPLSRVRVQIEVNNLFDQSIKLAYSEDGGNSYGHFVTLTSTTQQITQPIPYATFQSTMKARLFPYHPIICGFPTTGLTHGEQIISLSGNYTRYPQENCVKNNSLIAVGSFIPTITSFPPATMPNQSAPEILIKTFNDYKAVPDNSAYPLTGATDCRVSEIPPGDIAMCGEILGFNTTYSTNAGYTPSFDIQGTAIAGLTAETETYVVELLNFSRAIRGFVSNAPDFTSTTSAAYVGDGQPKAIIGVIPASQIEQPSGAFTKFVYNAPYPLPIRVEYNQGQTLYIKNLSFRLSDLQGRVIDDLESPSTLILRIVPDEKK